MVVIRTWKLNNRLQNSIIRYDAGSWFAEVTDESWRSFNILKRVKLAEDHWEEWVEEHDIPRLPRDAISVDELSMSWLQERQEQEQPQHQTDQPVHQKDQLSHQRDHLTSLQPPRPASRPSGQTHPQRPKQDHASLPQQMNNTTTMTPRTSSDSASRSQPDSAKRSPRGGHSSLHTSVRPPPPVIQPVIQDQPLKPSALSGELTQQCHIQAAVSLPVIAPLQNLPRKKGRRPVITGRVLTASCQLDNAQPVPGECYILD